MTDPSHVDLLLIIDKIGSSILEDCLHTPPDKLDSEKYHKNSKYLQSVSVYCFEIIGNN